MPRQIYKWLVFLVLSVFPRFTNDIFPLRQ